MSTDLCVHGPLANHWTDYPLTQWKQQCVKIKFYLCLIYSSGAGYSAVGWMWDQIQSQFSLQQSISSCVSRKAKAENKGNKLLHFRISLSDKLIYTLKQGWAAMCHGGLRGCRFHSSQRLCWAISLISSSTVTDGVLIRDISCYMAFDCYNNLESLHLPIACDGAVL